MMQTLLAAGHQQPYRIARNVDQANGNGLVTKEKLRSNFDITIETHITRINARKNANIDS
jgi:hypothetical protein